MRLEKIENLFKVVRQTTHRITPGHLSKDRAKVQTYGDLECMIYIHCYVCRRIFGHTVVLFESIYKCAYIWIYVIYEHNTDFWSGCVVGVSVYSVDASDICINIYEHNTDFKVGMW